MKLTLLVFTVTFFNFLVALPAVIFVSPQCSQKTNVNIYVELCIYAVLKVFLQWSLLENSLTTKLYNILNRDISQSNLNREWQKKRESKIITPEKGTNMKIYVAHSI